VAIVVYKSWQPDQPKLMLHEQSDGKVCSATLAPGVNSPILRPAFDWDCLGECVARFAQQVQGCLFTGLYWPQCVKDCCGAGLITCYTFFC
jgi:hypothetical protein